MPGRDGRWGIGQALRGRGRGGRLDGVDDLQQEGRHRVRGLLRHVLDERHARPAPRVGHGRVALHARAARERGVKRGIHHADRGAPSRRGPPPDLGRRKLGGQVGEVVRRALGVDAVQHKAHPSRHSVRVQEPALGQPAGVPLAAAHRHRRALRVVRARVRRGRERAGLQLRRQRGGQRLVRVRVGAAGLQLHRRQRGGQCLHLRPQIVIAGVGRARRHGAPATVGVALQPQRVALERGRPDGDHVVHVDRVLVPLGRRGHEGADVGGERAERVLNELPVAVLAELQLVQPPHRVDPRLHALAGQVGGHVSRDVQVVVLLGLEVVGRRIRHARLGQHQAEEAGAVRDGAVDIECHSVIRVRSSPPIISYACAHTASSA